MKYYQWTSPDGEALALFRRDAATATEEVLRDGEWHDDGGVLAAALVSGDPDFEEVSASTD